MKKFLKIFGITLGSIVGVLAIAIAVICNIIFTPEKLTPIVKNNADRFITCQYDLDEVDLTFFSSFPHFALRAKNVTLVNPMEGAPSDTLLHVGMLSGIVNAKEFIKSRAILVDGLAISNGTANVYIGSDGRKNFDIFVPSEKEEKEDTSMVFIYLGLNDIRLNDIDACYATDSMKAMVDNLNMEVAGRYFAEEVSADGKFNIKTDRVLFETDSLMAAAEELKANGEGIFQEMHFSGEINAKAKDFDLTTGKNKLIEDKDVEINLPCDANIQYMYANLYEGSKVRLEDNEIDVKGKVELCDNNDIYMGINFETNDWNLEETMKLMPENVAEALKDYEVSGKLHVDGKVNGTYAEDNMPLIFADVKLEKCKIAIKNVDYKLRVDEADIYADINLNEKSNIKINKLKAQANDIVIEADGEINDVLGERKCDLNVKSRDVELEDVKEFLPEDMNLDIKGDADVQLSANFALEDLLKTKLDKIKAKGTIEYTDLDVKYNDSIHVVDNKGILTINFPSNHKNKHFKELGQVGLKGTNLNFDMTGTMKAKAKDANLTVGIGNILDTTKFYEADCQFAFAKLEGEMDTIKFKLANPSGTASLFPMKSNKKQPGVTASYKGGQVDFAMGSTLSFNSETLNFNGFTTYDQKKDNILLKLNPTLNIDFKNGLLKTTAIEPDIVIPNIDFKFTPQEMDINKSRIQVKNSDFNLSGKITNIRGFLEDNKLLKGELQFESDQTNVDELMALVNGAGESENKSESSEAKEDAQTEDNPFMVPKGVDIALNTKINKAIFNEKELRNIKGKLTVKDGVLIAEQMGLTSDAAEMQLTGIYRSERKNHIFCGLDLHLLDINIHELIDLIPSLDTIVPMLKSFEGRAEFHLAAETYLKSNYDIKFSTLRGAAALEGKDLVLLDNETFTKISKLMMFNKKTRNLVDSLSVEATLFRNEVDVYPFLVSIDKWQAVLAGRHNLDMSFNYHISLTDCPLPARLGLDLYGPSYDDMKFKLVPCQYKALYKPEKRGEVEQRTLELKKMISDALKANVK